MSAILEEEPISRRASRRSRPTLRSVRAEMWAEQNGKCCYCGNATRLPNQPEHSDLPVATIEHRISVANGGTNDRDNLAVSCSPCNHAKGDLDEAEFVRRGCRGRPLGVSRQMTQVAKRMRRQGRRPSPERDRAVVVGNAYVVMELAIRDIVQDVSAARFRAGGELHGTLSMWRRQQTVRLSKWEGVIGLMEIQIARRVQQASDARYSQQWGKNRLPKAGFDKSLAATFSLADLWPERNNMQIGG